MLSVAPSEPQHHHRIQPHQYLPPPTSSPLYRQTMPHRVSISEPKELPSSVTQALEVARESADGALDPTICKILDNAVETIWGKINAKPNDYVMTRDEFAIFNYYQRDFRGNKIAVDAKKRYWDNLRA